MNNTHPLLYVALGVAVIIFWAMAAKFAVKLMGIDIKDPARRGDARVALVGTVANMLMILTMLILFTFVAGKELSQLGFGFNIKHLIFSALVILLSFGAALIFIRILHLKNIVIATWMKDPIKLPMIIGASILLFLAAFQEELIFRGYFAINLIGYGFLVALIISSLAFMAIHFITNKANFFQSIEWLMGGVALFTVYVASGSIWVATLLHLARNMANVTILSLTFGLSFFSFDKPIAPAYKFIYTTALSLIWIVLAVLFYRL